MFGSRAAIRSAASQPLAVSGTAEALPAQHQTRPPGAAGPVSAAGGPGAVDAEKSHEESACAGRR